MLGMFAGVLATGAALPSLQRLYLATGRGGLTLPRLLGIPEGVVILAVVGVALVAFGFTARIERRALLSSRTSEASVGIYSPVVVAGGSGGTPDRPEGTHTRSLRSLLRDDNA
jgi:hypothetical protein